MRESRSYGSVGERGGNEPLYPESGKRKAEVGRGTAEPQNRRTEEQMKFVPTKVVGNRYCPGAGKLFDRPS